MIIRCNQCDNQFETTIKSRKFCSKYCFHSSISQKSCITCCYCGRVSRKSPWEIKRHKNIFCSQECANSYKRENPATGDKNSNYNSIERSCSYCNKPLLRTISRTVKCENFFCNRDCLTKWRILNRSGRNSPLWTGSRRNYRGSNWVNQRYLARMRDNNTCQHCGITKDEIGRELDVHHIIPFRHFDDYQIANALPNLITLCSSCHKKAEPRKGTI